MLIDIKMKEFIRDPENEDNRKAVIQLITCDALPVRMVDRKKFK